MSHCSKQNCENDFFLLSLSQFSIKGKFMKIYVGRLHGIFVSGFRKRDIKRVGFNEKALLIFHILCFNLYGKCVHFFALDVAHIKQIEQLVSPFIQEKCSFLTFLLVCRKKFDISSTP